ncbi:MAG: tetratricopeptide repeat protein [Deltaproteobacteria bacterium]|nr:tetratricopeptide repeat protein [Deltaproteobacteria bacterium]
MNELRRPAHPPDLEPLKHPHRPGGVPASSKVGPFCQRAVALSRANQLQPSREALRKAIEKSSSATDWMLVGSAYQTLGEGRAALSAYRRAARLDPRSGNAYRALGAMLLAGGDLQSASLTLRVALALDPAESRTQVLLADTLSQLGQHDEAHRLMAHALAQAPGSPPHMMALARILGRANRRQDAEEALDDVLQASPGDLDATLALVQLLVERQDQARARVELRRISRRQMRSADAAIKVGQAFMECGGLDEALEVFQWAVQHHPESGEAHFEWGRALEAAQRFDEALKALDSAVRLIPHSVAAHYHLGRLLERSAKNNALRPVNFDVESQPERVARNARGERRDDGGERTYDRGLPAPNTPSGDDDDDDDDDALQAAFEAVRSDDDELDKTQRTGAALQGDLAVLVLSETLEFLTDQRATGRLKLRSERGEGQVDFVGGLCARAIGPKSQPLSVILEDSDGLGLAEDRRLADHELAATLLKQRGVEAPRLREALGTQALAGLSEMLMWNRGQVAFHATADDQVPHTPELLFDLRPILKTSKKHMVRRPPKP